MQVGFYYKTFIRPRRLWPFYEKILRNAAGLGRLDEEHRRTERYEKVHRHVDVLVIGGGQSGLEAATEAASAGKHTVVVDEGLALGGRLAYGTADEMRERDALVEASRAAGVEFLQPAYAGGVYEGLLVPVFQGKTMYRFRAAELVLATGSIEQPLVFGNNDLPGIMLGGAARRLDQPVPHRPRRAGRRRDVGRGGHRRRQRPGRGRGRGGRGRRLARHRDGRPAVGRGHRAPDRLRASAGQGLEARDRRGRRQGRRASGRSAATCWSSPGAAPAPTASSRRPAAASATTASRGATSRTWCRRACGWSASSPAPRRPAAPCPPRRRTRAASSSSASARTSPPRTSTCRSARASRRWSCPSATRPSPWGRARAGCATATPAW